MKEKLRDKQDGSRYFNICLTGVQEEKKKPTTEEKK